MKSVYIETYGCQMNLYDSELVESILLESGYEIADEVMQADIIMLNTCSVREHATDVVFNRIFRLRHDAGDKKLVIGILGCMASNYKTKLFENRRLNIAFIVGPDNYKNLPVILDNVFAQKKEVFDVELSMQETYEELFPRHAKGVNAWIAIMRGCNNFCSYCIVPYTRGRERSRSVASIIDESSKLIELGFKQITLLGQNVNSYSFEGEDFASLVSKLSILDGLERIRFMSPHPKDFSDSLIDIIADNKKICNHIHLPLQAGSDRILKMMNRNYTRQDYLGLVDRIRIKIPDVKITADIIVGFPTESLVEYEDTVSVVRQVEFDSAFIFKYSEREGTKAFKEFKDDISEVEKKRRVTELNSIQRDISLIKNKNEIGQVQEVLIEQETTKRSEEEFMGRSDGNKIVIFPAVERKAGDIISVKITEATSNVLRGIPQL